MKGADHSAAVANTIMGGLSLMYFWIWFFIAFPYLPFPSDDVLIWHTILNPQHFVLDTYKPVYDVFFKTAINISQSFGEGFGLTWILATVLPNMVTLFLTGVIIFRLTNRFLPALGGMLFFSTSAWPAKYQFLNASYAPFAAMLTMIHAYLLLEAFRHESNRQTVLFAWAGLVGALLIMSCASAAVTLACFIPMSIALSHRLLTNLVAYVSAFLLAVVPFIYFNGNLLIKHLIENVRTDHNIHAIEKFGYIPESPFGSFAHILSVDSPSFIVIFMLVMTFLVVGRSAGRKPVNKIEKVTILLLCTVVLHAVTIDLLPFTKLGRTHFLIIPLLLMVFSLMIYIGCTHFWKQSNKWAPLGLVLLMMIPALENLNTTRTNLLHRISTPILLEEYASNRQILLLTDDPHARILLPWLTSRVNLNFTFLQDPSVINQVTSASVLLVGPHGKGSGNSVQRHSVLPDYFFDEKEFANVIIEKKIFPYYAYLPSILMEEEISQALYFEGKSPDYRLDDFNLTAYSLMPR